MKRIKKSALEAAIPEDALIGQRHWPVRVSALTLYHG